MNFKLIIDKTKEEEIAATVHERSQLIDQIETLVMQDTGTDKVTAYLEDEIRLLPFTEIECITVLNGKTYAISTQAKQYLIKQRLYELEKLLPTAFMRINKSAIANASRLERFTASYSGAVNAVFQCGYTEYVSRRCFSVMKRRIEGK